MALAILIGGLILILIVMVIMMVMIVIMAIIMESYNKRGGAQNFG